MLRVTSLTHLLLMQTLITLQTIHNYNAIRNRKDEFIVYLGLLSVISSPHLLSDIGTSFVHHETASYAKPMQFKLERELIGSPFESFKSFVLLSRDVTASRN